MHPSLDTTTNDPSPNLLLKQNHSYYCLVPRPSKMEGTLSQSIFLARQENVHDVNITPSRLLEKQQ